MKKNTTKTLLILLGLGIGGYIIYKYLYGNKIPWIDIDSGGGSSGGGGSTPTTPTQPAPQIPTTPPSGTGYTPLPNTWYEDKQGIRTGTVPVVSPKPGQYQGGPFVTTPEVPSYFAPVTNSHIPQLVIIGKAPEIVPTVQPVNQVSTSDLKAFALQNPILKTQAPVNFVSVSTPVTVKPVIQLLPLKAFGVNVTAQPSITLPQKVITQEPIVQIKAGTTKLSTIMSVPVPTKTPVPTLTNVLKGLITR